MALHKVSKLTRGFTLIEVLIVIGLIAVLGGVSLIFGMDSFRGYTFHAERDLLVTTLYRARALSINNLCVGACTDGIPHGVHVTDSAFIIFQGTTFDEHDSTNESVPRQARNIIVTGDDPVFEQLSANASPTALSLHDSTHVSVITVGSQGQILWTH